MARQNNLRRRLTDWLTSPGVVAILLGMAGVLIVVGGVVYHHCACQGLPNFVAGWELEFEALYTNLATTLIGIAIAVFAIARALANDPPMLIADEPTGNLDSRTAEAVFQLFAGLVQDGKTVVMVTHDADLVYRADRVITIADGMIVGQVYRQAATSVCGNDHPAVSAANQNYVASISR